MDGRAVASRSHHPIARTAIASEKVEDYDSTSRHSAMRKKRTLLLAGAAVAAVAGTSAIVWYRSRNPPPPPVGLRFIGNRVDLNDPYFRSFATFLVTNYTPKHLVVFPDALLAREGAKWTRRDCFGWSTYLGPYETGYVTLDFSRQKFQRPTNSWRLTVMADERVDGTAAFFAKIQQYPYYFWNRSNTNFPFAQNPFAQGTRWYGHPRRVQSEVVTDPPQ